MRTQIKLLVTMLLLFCASYLVSAQENITIVTPNSRIAEGLDLNAVAELFKDSENLEEFEKALNDPEIGINNLDLDGDGYVDYIRVVEQVVDDTHVIILQVALGQDEFQDVATIEIERTGTENYNMQVRGNDVIYGVDYYISPVYVHVHHIHGWRIMPWLFRPMYRPYYSVFYFGYYPGWWVPYRPVVIHVYHNRTERYTRRAAFEYTRVSRVETIHKVNYQQRTSPRVREEARAAQPSPAPERISRQSNPAEQTTPERQDVRTTNNNIDKTTIKNDAERITAPKANRNTTVKNEAEKITKPNVRTRTTVNSDAQKIPKSKPEVRSTVQSDAKKIAKPEVVKKAPIKNDSKRTTAKEKKDKS
ncbi:MAG TPA: hypothetical protein VGD14_07630 [bacterium]